MERKNRLIRLDEAVWQEFKNKCNDLGYRKTNEVVEAMLIAFNQNQINLAFKKTTTVDVQVNPTNKI